MLVADLMALFQVFFRTYMLRLLLEFYCTTSICSGTPQWQLAVVSTVQRGAAQ